MSTKGKHVSTFRKRRWPSPAVVIAVAALGVALTSTGAYGAASNFLLNTGNTGTNTTSLTASAVAGAGLQLTNTNTAKAATALGLNVAKGHAPFTVNSGTKVKQLNADRLDGIDSSGFLHGQGSSYTKVIAIPVGGTGFTDTMLPGLGTVTLACFTGNVVSVEFIGAVDGEDLAYRYDPHGSEVSNEVRVGPTETQSFQVEGGASLFEFSLQGDINGVQTVGTLTIGGAYRSATNDCAFQVQGITTHE